METADNATLPKWKSVYAPTTRQKPQLNPAGGAEGSKARVITAPGAGRELHSTSHLATGANKLTDAVKVANSAFVSAATPTRHSATNLCPTKGLPGRKTRQQTHRTTSNISPWDRSDPGAPPRQLQCSQQQGHEQDNQEQQLILHSKHPSADHAGDNKQPEALAAGLQEAVQESEFGAACRRTSSSPRQSRQPGSQLLSPYLAALPRPSSSMPRRPRSPGPRPGSPLCGLRRLPAGDRNSSSGGNQDPSPAINSTLLASSIYGRRQLTSRLGLRSAPRPKRPHFYPQQRCAFEIQVNYGPAESHGESGASASTYCHSMADAPVAATTQLAEEPQSSSKSGESATSSQTAQEGWTGAAQQSQEPDLGMTLSEYIAQMHTTPVACNSVSGLGDETDDEQFAGHPGWGAAPMGGSILAAWGMSGTAVGEPQGCQPAGASSLGFDDSQLAHHAAAAAGEFLAAEGHDKHQQERLGSSSSGSSVGEAMHTEVDAFMDSEGPSDIECYPDIDSSSESDQGYQPDTKTATGLTATDGDAGFLGPRQTAWPGTPTLAPAANALVSTGNVRPQGSTTQRSSGLLSPTLSSGARVPPAPWMNSLDLRPASAAGSLPWRGRTAADSATDPGVSHNRPRGNGQDSQQRNSTDLDSSSDGVVKQTSLGQLSAALFAPTTADAGDISSNRASLQQLWAGSSSLVGGNSDRRHMGRFGGHEPVAGQSQAGAGISSGLCDGSVDEQVLEETPSSFSGSGVQRMPQQLAWGAPAARASRATTQQSAADTAPAPAELINSNSKRLFSTRAPGPLYVTRLHEQGHQRILQRPPSRQRPPAQSLHLFSAAGFVSTQIALAGSQAGLFDSPLNTARAATSLQGIDRPGSAMQQGGHRPMSASR